MQQWNILCLQFAESGFQTQTLTAFLSLISLLYCFLTFSQSGPLVRENKQFDNVI